MAKLNLDYYSGENFYSDGDVENEILQIARRRTSPEQIDDVKFPVLYHLSKVRENILNWYPFDKERVVLEIGSGCGAITGLLCERLSRVVSVELSKRRADINFARHERLSNLEIWVGNLNDMVFGETFDYIVLNGVFEYAASFTEGEWPYRRFLSSIRRLLKPDGVVLIAIENRLGLKYFAGAPEDHTDGYFDGIREYVGNCSVRTFSKGEWERMLLEEGLFHYRFYYPYPDYKFPREIFTDESLREQRYGAPAWNFTPYRMALFSEARVAAALQAEGVMAHFANSFLIEASASPLSAERRVRYVKLNTDRDCHFSIATRLEDRGDERVVVKSPMTYEAERHIRHMAEVLGDYGTWRTIPGKTEGKSIAYPYLRGESLAAAAARAAADGDADRVKALIAKVYDICCGDTGNERVRRMTAGEMSARERAEFQRVFGAETVDDGFACVVPANIDLILDNIFEMDQTYYVIDCEWVFDFPVPVLFILWRAVNELYSGIPDFGKVCPKDDMLKEYGISQKMSEAFHRWGTHFAEHYVGANRLLAHSIPEIGVSLEEFRRRRREQEHMVSQLFVDTGNGFNEEEKLIAESATKDGAFTAVFDLRKFGKVRALRFDPVEGVPCVCHIDRERTNVRLTAENASGKAEGGDLFLTTDPMYFAKSGSYGSQVRISGEIRVLQISEALKQAGELLKGGRWTFWRR